jgi:sarcosine oxidase subunit gamma
MDAGAVFAQSDESAVVARYADPVDEAAQARNLAIVDLGTLPRVGFKGGDCEHWLAESGVLIPDRPNMAVRQMGRGLVLRLSRQEFMLLPDPTARETSVNDLDAGRAFASGRRIYALQRQHSHCWFAVCGNLADSLLAKLCAIDLRPAKFVDLRIAQTSVARLSAIVVRVDIAKIPCFYCLCDVTAAEYLWTTLVDAMQEFDGRPVGTDALRHLQMPGLNSRIDV